MRTQHFSLSREYEICCKLFAPDHGDVKNIILGVHGFAGDKESSVLEKLANALSQKQTALICFDFPAHGESPVGEEMLTVENCKKDLCFVMEHITKTYPDANKSVFATSFGGYITLLCAEKLANAKLVLRAPAVTMPKVLLDNVLKITAEDFEKANSIRCGFERPIHLPYSFYNELLQQESILDKKISSPILIIHGNRDDIVPLEDVLAFADAQKEACLEIMDGADHRFKNKGELEKIVEITINYLDVR